MEAGSLGSLTGVNELEALSRGVLVGEELQPEVIGRAGERHAHHGRPRECAEDVSRVVLAIVELGETQVHTMSLVPSHRDT